MQETMSMKLFIAVSSIAMIMYASFANAQTQSSSTKCDECGNSATYSETISTTSNGYKRRVITTSGCPNHYRYHIDILCTLFKTNIIFRRLKPNQEFLEYILCLPQDLAVFCFKNVQHSPNCNPTYVITNKRSVILQLFNF